MRSELKGAIIGLLGFAAAEEQILLAASRADEPGDASHWAAFPLVAHNTEFKAQQVHRLAAIRNGHAPDEFAEVDHGAPSVYREYLAQPADQIATESSRVSADLIAGVGELSAADLFDPARNPWLKGRQLWLQIIVRGFWHPAGHLMGYYLTHSAPDRAVALAAHGVSTAAYLAAPDPAQGMASYNLACAYASTGALEQAAEVLAESIRRNPDLSANAARDPDLALLRSSGRPG
jgi:hypothetical protein